MVFFYRSFRYFIDRLGLFNSLSYIYNINKKNMSPIKTWLKTFLESYYPNLSPEDIEYVIDDVLCNNITDYGGKKIVKVELIIENFNSKLIGSFETNVN